MSITGTAGSPGDFIPETSAAPPKRRRLNFACNFCRGRKQKCDEQKPSCHACLVAGVPCVTVDRRRPGVVITRHEAGVMTTDHRGSTSRDYTESAATYSTQLAGGRGSVVATTPSTTDTWDGSQWRRSTGHKTAGSDAAGDLHAEKDMLNQTVKYSGRIPMRRQSRGQNTLELLTDWLELAFYRFGINKSQGRSYLLERVQDQCFQHPVLCLDMPSLPSSTIALEWVSCFFTEVNSIFPLLDAQETHEMLELAISHGPSRLVHERGFLSLLLVYLVLNLGASGSQDKTWQHTTLSYLNYCKTFVGHIMGCNTLPAVQVMLLLSLGYKHLDQIPSSWSSLSSCISMATSIGLHLAGSVIRPVSVSSASHPDLRKIQTWQSIYCFEKLFSFEVGRSSLIIGTHCHHSESIAGPSKDIELHSQDPSFLGIVAGLAEVLAKINQRCDVANRAEEKARTSGLDSAIREKVRTTGAACMELMKWADDVPSKYRPRSDFVYDMKDFPLASFLSLQYNNALLMLTRNSLLVSDMTIKLSVDNIAKGAPWEHIIRNGHSIAANAARRIIRLLMESVDLDSKPFIHSYAMPLHALYILSVNIIRHPHARMVKSDLNLISDAADFAKQQYELIEADDKLQIVLSKLDVVVSKVLECSTVPGASRSSRSVERTPASATTSPASVLNQPQVFSTDSHYYPSSQNTPTGSGRPFLAQENYGPLDIGSMDFGSIFSELSALSHGTPEFAHDIGWGWVDFTQVFPDTPAAVP